MMSIQEIACILRYILAALSVVYVFLLTRLAVRELRWDMRHRVLPVPGCYLQPLPSGPPAASPEVIPLYHTTHLGHAATCDVHLRRSGPARSQAIIYLFDGVWFLRPATRKRDVRINGVRILPATPLEDGDHLTVGGENFLFASKRTTLDDAAFADSLPTAFADGPRIGAWLALSLLALLGSGLAVFLTPADYPELRLLLAVFCLGYLIMVNVVDLLLAACLEQVDRLLMLGLEMLAFLGIIFQIRLSISSLVSSGSGSLAPSVVHDLTSQGIALIAGLILVPAIAMLVARTRLLELLGYICVALTPLLLLTTLVLGQGSENYGATLWIVIGGQSIQLTEFAKITYLIVLASFFKIRPARHIQLLFAGWAALVFFLVMLLPDIGMAMILLPTTLVVFVVMTSEYWTTLLVMAAGTGAGIVALGLFPHVRNRLAGWTSLWSEVNDSNRQIVYGLQAIARGGLFGRGIGNGSPGGIPLASSDMIYAIVWEEAGMIVGLCIVLVFIIFWLRAARIAATAQDGLTSCLALGIGTALFMEAFVVIGGVTGLIPLTGVTLPFIAEGGSSILAKSVMLAILIGLSARHTGVRKKCAS